MGINLGREYIIKILFVSLFHFFTIKNFINDKNKK